MNIGKSFGFVLFIGGIVLLMAYSLFLGFDEIVDSIDVVSGVLVALVMAGFFILLGSIIVEQRRNKDEAMKDISEEDLKP